MDIKFEVGNYLKVPGQFIDSKLINPVKVALSNEYEREVDPLSYEEYVLSESLRRDLFAQEVGDLMTRYSEVPSQNREMTALDIAAGSGIISRHISQLGYSVTATDLSPSLLSYLKSTSADINVVCADMNCDLPFGDNQFDVVTTVWANRFIKNNSQFLQNVHRVLKPDGTFVWPIFVAEAPIWILKSGFKNPVMPNTVADMARNVGFKEVITIQNPLYFNLIRKRPPLHVAPSFVVAKK